ncbi:MAG: ExbD/TolR family protein [Gammaproteobacteria bacterium]
MLLRKRRNSARLSLTPLIDVVFILLIFFMIESDFLRPYVMDLTHQSGGAANPDSTHTPILIELHSDNTYWVNKTRHPFENIEAVLIDFEASVKSPVVIASDTGVVLQQAVDVLDIVQSLGFSNVSLQKAKTFE